MAKRERPDIHQMVAVLSTIVKKPNEIYYKKLVIMIKYFNWTKKKYLTLIADDLKLIKWYVDNSFVVNTDFKSHPGAIITTGQGAMQSVSRKKKLNTRISKKA